MEPQATMMQTHQVETIQVYELQVDFCLLDPTRLA